MGCFEGFGVACKCEIDCVSLSIFLWVSNESKIHRYLDRLMSRHKAKKKSTRTSKKKQVKSALPFKLWQVFLAAAVIGFAVYGNTLSHGYVLDDHAVIDQNRIVKKGLSGIPEILTTTYWAGYASQHDINDSYRPVPLILNAIEFQFFGLSPSVSHGTNILIHSINSVLIFLFLFALFRGKNLPVIGMIALLFLVHPVHTEVVANIKGRDDLLAFTGMLGSLLFYQKWLSSANIKSLIWALLCFGLALLSKESVVFAIAVFLLYPFYFKEMSMVPSLKKGVPFLALGLLYVIVRMSLTGAATLQEVSFVDNPLVSIDNAMQYLAVLSSTWGLMAIQLTFPWQLVSDYSFNAWAAEMAFGVRSVIGVGALGLICFIAIKGYKNRTQASFFSLFVLASLFLVSHLVFPYVNIFAERSMYTPSFPFTVLIVLLILKGVDLIKSRNILKGISVQKLLVGSCLSLGLLYSARTIIRNPAWQSDEVLFATDVQNSPESFRLNYLYGNELALQAARTGGQSADRMRLAEQHLVKANALVPDVPRVLLALGNVYKVSNDLNRAEEYYLRCIELGFDQNTAVYFNLGYVAQKRNDVNGAIRHYSKSLEIDSDYIPALVNLGTLYGMQNDLDRSIQLLERVLVLDPDHVNARKNLARARSLKK